jgi:hypothetical protein
MTKIFLPHSPFRLSRILLSTSMGPPGKRAKTHLPNTAMTVSNETYLSNNAIIRL